MLLRNKVGLVTGGGDGIGRGTCQALAEQGARVVVSDVNAESGGETAELIRQAGGGGTTDSMLFQLFFHHSEVVGKIYLY